MARQIRPKADAVGDFTSLDDVPTSYTGHAGEVLTVKITEDGLEFSPCTSTDQFVKSDPTDPTTGTLNEKIGVASGEITKTLTQPGGPGTSKILQLGVGTSVQQKQTDFAPKVYKQGTTPNLSANETMAIWENTTTSEIYLIYKDSSGTAVAVEMTAIV